MLRWVEGFGHDQSQTNLKWDGTLDTFWQVQAVGRFDTYGAGPVGGPLDMRGGGYKNFGGSETTWTVGIAVKMITYSNGNPVALFSGWQGGSRQWRVEIDSTGRLVFARGTTTVETGTTILGTDWRYLEAKVVCDNTVGEYEVKIDGVTEMADTGVDTQAQATAAVDRINFMANDDRGDTAIIACYCDDIYVCDSVDSGVTGAPNNDFLGDVKVQTLMPNGNGNTSNFVGSDADSTDNYLLVDEVPSGDGDTTYVESSTVSDKDTYAYENLASAAGTVYGMMLSPFARKTDAGTREICTITRLAGTEEDGPNQPLSAGYVFKSDIREADPAGIQWTVANVNAAEFGVKVTV